MQGVHDMGGVPGYGPVVVESNEPVFHHSWEGLAFALNMVSIGQLRAYNADAYRHSVERVPDYLSRSYYERLLIGVSTLLVEGGVIKLSDLEVPLCRSDQSTELPLDKVGMGTFDTGAPDPACRSDRNTERPGDEVGTTTCNAGAVPLSTPIALDAAGNGSVLQIGSSQGYERGNPKFTVGDAVQVVAVQTSGHTRCPAYIRGAVGTIEQVNPLAHVPEVRAHTLLRCREHTYAVTFEAHSLWPDDSTATANHLVIVEVFESYLADCGVLPPIDASVADGFLSDDERAAADSVIRQAAAGTRGDDEFRT
jgi:nitrile hydratase subunit beta